MGAQMVVIVLPKLAVLAHLAQGRKQITVEQFAAK